MLKKITISGLRGFGVENTIEFSIPNLERGGGLSVIIGANNTGKTTIVEGIKYYQCDKDSISFSEGKRNAKTDKKVKITYNDENDKTVELYTVNNGGSQVELIGTTDYNNIPFVLPSRRFVEYNMNKTLNIPRVSYLLSQFTTNRKSTLNQYEYRIFKWVKNKNEFDKILKKIILEPFDWTVELNDSGSYYVKIIFPDNKIVHTREGVGDGFWSIFTIVDCLYDSRPNDIIVIDEPELSLHPIFQKRVLELLVDYSKERQIIISTHSPYFISHESIINGGNIIRTYKDNNGNIETNSITNDDREFLKNIDEDINNPHIFGLDAKEIFFCEENIIVTEGQEDVIIINKICKTLNIKLEASLFGWGAGGAGNIFHILEMLSHLGYKKVSAIFDGDKKSLYEKCKKQFPYYNIIILFKDDIRDKEEHFIKAKVGITQKNGNIKEEYKDKFLNIINKINNYHLKK